MNTRVYHFSLTPDDFVYNERDYTYYVALNMPGLEVYDKVNVEIFKSMYSFNTITRTNTLYLSTRMKPYKVIRIRVTVTKVY